MKVVNLFFKSKGAAGLKWSESDETRQEFVDRILTTTRMSSQKGRTQWGQSIPKLWNSIPDFWSIHMKSYRFHNLSILNLTKFQLIQTIVIFIFSIGCLIELKFCEVSRNSFLNRCWKFQLSILKNKKGFIPKKSSSRWRLLSQFSVKVLDRKELTLLVFLVLQLDTYS